MLRKKMSLTVVAFLLIAGSASAAELYVGAGLSGEVEAGSLRHGDERFAVAGGDPWKLFAGWRLGRYLALEVGRHDLGVQRCCVPEVADFGFTSRVDGFSAAVLGRRPVGRFAPFVKVGVQAWEEKGEVITIAGPISSSAGGTDLLLGAGVDVELPARFAVRADWERYDFGRASSDGLWASLLYRF